MAYHTSPWPGFDEAPPPVVPVVINAGRPGRNRGRLASEHALPRQTQFYYSPDGQLLVPAGGNAGPAHHRASSISGGRPAQVIINNDNLSTWDDHSGRRPRSVHYYDYEHDYRDYSRERSRSRRRRHSRTPSPYEHHEYREDPETKDKLKKLADLERKEEEKRREKELKEKMMLEKAKRDAEEAERAKEDKQLREKAIAEYKQKEQKAKEKEKKEKEEADEEFAERMRKTLRSSGYTETQIDHILNKKGKGGKAGSNQGTNVVALSRPTYIRVRRKHLDPETLDLYQLPWEWDDTDDSFIIIKQWIPEREQEILFEHTRKLRERKQITYTTTELRKERDQLLLVKKKEPRKRSPSRNWLLT